MCNLYRLRADRGDFLDYYHAVADPRRDVVVEKDYAAPGKPGYAVRMEGGQRVLSEMLWGFPTKTPRKRPPKEGQLPYLVEWWTNARNLGNNMWKPWLSKPEHRCLVPFTQFAEPKAAAMRADKADTNAWFSATGRAVGTFAGIWKEDPDLGRVYAFLTCDPNPLVAPIHPKAMPVILHPEDYDRWLAADFTEACSMQSPYPSQLMAMEEGSGE